MKKSAAASSVRQIRNVEPKAKSVNPWLKSRREAAELRDGLQKSASELAAAQAQIARLKSAMDPPERRPLGVVAQVRCSLRRENRLAALLGGLLGAVVPVGGYWLAHHEVSRSESLWTQPMAWLVLAGLLYSSTSVYRWGKAAFGDGFKAFGFCVLLEGMLVASRTSWLSATALCYLAVINAIAAGTRLALEGKEARVK